VDKSLCNAQINQKKSRGKSLSSLLLYKNDPGLRQLHSSGIQRASQDESALKLEMDHSQISAVLTCKTTLCLVMGRGGKGHQGGAGGQLWPEKHPNTGYPPAAGCRLPAALQDCDHPSTRHGCSAKQKWGRVWHPGSGSRGEPGCAGKEQRVRADCASPAQCLRFDRSAFLAEGIWLCNRFLERCG